MRTGKRLAAAAVAAFAAMAFAGTADAADKTVTIGIVTATSGPLAAAGKFQLNGFNLAADAINAKGGIRIGGDSYKVALKVYDTHCNAAEGASAMQRLATIDHVPAALGEVCSPVGAAEAAVAQDFSIPLVLTVPTAPDLTKQGNRFLFRVNADNDQLTKALAAFVGQHAQWSPLSFIAWNNDAGRGGVNGMKALLPKDFKLGYVGYFNVGEVDFSSHITNIRNGGGHSVMLLMDEEPGALAIRQIRDAGLNVQLIGTLAMGSDRFLKRVPAKYLAGMVQYNAFPPSAPVPRIEAFSKAYKDRFHEEAHGFAAQSYDGLMMVAKAMETAGTASDGKKIRDALAGETYEGVIGTIKFDKDNQAAPPVYITEWCQDGKRKIDYPADLKSACGAG
ncbi:MAG TPA: ABC transporter substrate-binding protein [Hyphomicrobiales bacterium]|nr:ABC transporter substrate-binding protein [Hyphomicrobiales bacterium]